MIAELDVALSYGCPRRGVPASTSFARWAQAALAAAGAQGAFQLSIRVVDADEGLALNRDFRGKAYATNVLSFPADAVFPGGPRLLGDLALCAPVIEREAGEQGKRPAAHYAHLTVHGVLHLLGYDHEAEAAAAAMEALELKALAALGVANPYESAQG
jgi:probable rRNA maturation factor